MRGIFVSFTLVVGAMAGAAGQQAMPRTAATSTDADLFDDRLLQRVELQVSERDWATLRQDYLLNTYYPATLVWRGETVRNVGIRSRGTGTRSGTKPNLLVDFDRYVTGQRFLGLEGLILDNHLQDPSGMRVEDRVKPFTNEEFEAAVAFNLDFARRRPAIVRAQLAGVAASAR